MSFKGLALVTIAVLGSAALLVSSAVPAPSGTPDALRAAADEFEALETQRNALLLQVDDLNEQVTEQAAEIERLQAIIDSFPSPTPPPTTTPPTPMCTGTTVTMAEQINAAPAGESMCLNTEIRVTTPLVLKAGQTLAGSGIVNGSIPVTNWAPDSSLWVSTGRTEGPTVLCMAGLNPCDGNEMLVPQARFADDIYYDGTVLSRTATLLGLRSAVAPSFFFDYAADRVYINRDPAGHRVELAVATGGIRSDADNITLDGITVEKTTGTGVYFLGGQDWTVSGVTTRLNHGSGMRLGGGAEVTDSSIVWNGMLGMGGSGSGLVVSDSEIGWNNYARYQKAPNGGCWSAGAMKWTHATITFTDNYSHHNWCDGWWADNDVTAMVTGNTFEANLRLGAFWELQNDGGTLTFRNNLVIDNGADGIRASDAGNALIENNTFRGNETAFAVGDSSRPGGPQGIVFRNNILNGQSTPGCSFAGVTCSGNV